MLQRYMKFGITALMIGTVTIVMAAQKQQNRQGGNSGPQPPTIVSFEGVVQSVNMGFGQGHPSFTLTKADGVTSTFIAGPYYVLVENDFTIKVGDRLSGRAFPSLRLENTYVVLDLTNLDTGAVVILRDDNGIPLWTGGGRSRTGMGPYCDAHLGPVNPSEIISLEGTVGNVDMAVGRGHPSFSLTTTGGETITILTGPYYIFVENEFSINRGDLMSVRGFASYQLENSYVAVELRNLTTGAVLVLRDENGIPIWSPRVGRPR